jgi:hypothetical protein
MQWMKDCRSNGSRSLCVSEVYKNKGLTSSHAALNLGKVLPVSTVKRQRKPQYWTGNWWNISPGPFWDSKSRPLTANPTDCLIPIPQKTCTHFILRRVCYNERMLQRTVFINKGRMLQRKLINTIGRRNTCIRMTCRAFPLTLERQP